MFSEQLANIYKLSMLGSYCVKVKTVEARRERDREMFLRRIQKIEQCEYIFGIVQNTLIFDVDGPRP